VEHEPDGKPPRQSPFRGCGWTALLLVTVLSVWLYFGIRQSKYLLPSESVDTLGRLASAPPPTRKLSMIEDQGSRYFVWIGRTRTVMMASGPPVYVFDASGNLVGRTIDIGDSGDDRLRRYFHLALAAREVAFKDALNLVNPK
jgi:hypothetical protein